MRMKRYALTAALVALLTWAAQGQVGVKAPKPKQTPRPNQPPTVKLVPSADRLTLPGCDDTEPATPWCPSESPKIKLSAQAADPDDDTMLYTYTTTGGRLEGEGPEVTLDLKGVAPGIYTVKIEVDDGNGGIATDTTKIEVSRCSCDRDIFDPPRCPTITVSCPDTQGPDGSLTFTASVAGGDPNVTPTWKWKVAGGEITSGQGTYTITVDASQSVAQPVTATLEVGGYGRDYYSCKLSTSCTFAPGYPRMARKVDEYGDLRADEENSRLRNFAAELRNDATAQGYLVCYGGKGNGAGAARRRCERAREQVVSARDLLSVVTVDGGFREEPTIELWVVPAGAAPPTPTLDPKEVRPPRAPRKPRRDRP